MNRRSPCLVILALLVALPALGAGADALTGEPVPAPLGDLPTVVPPPVARDGDLDFLAHIAEGTSKSVRLLPGDVTVWQNGAWLIATGLSDPAAPVELGRYLLPAQPSDMLVMDSMLYVALRKGQGLLILDYADPANPSVVGTLDGFDLLVDENAPFPWVRMKPAAPAAPAFLPKSCAAWPTIRICGP